MTVSRHGFVVCQLGARMHYAVPRFLHEAGLLRRFYTDVYATDAWQRWLGALSGSSNRARRLASRRTALPESVVRSYPIFGLRYAMRNARAEDNGQASEVFLWAGRTFGNKVVRDGFAGAAAVYAFNTAALEIFRAAREQGLRTVLEQTIAPRAIEEDIMRAERARHPGWDDDVPNENAAATIDREEEEWQLADLIVCGSEFVRDGIRRRGGPLDRCAVVAYGVDQPGNAPVVRRRHDGPLRVLTVGHVGLRKGAPYALALARALGTAAEFRWVGPIQVPEARAGELSAHLQLIGKVARNEVQPHYEWADVFFLPSVCEGSATVTYEALAAGLPVVTTAAAGSPIRDGVDGFIVDARDVDGMSERLQALRSNASLLEQMSSAALSASERLTADAYKARLLPVLTGTVH